MPIVFPRPKIRPPYKRADGDPLIPETAIPPILPAATAPKSNVKKYLLWGVVIIGAYLLYKKFGNK